MSDLDRSISGVVEVVGALACRDAGYELGDVVVDRVNGASLCHSHPVFDLGKHLFDGVEVRRIGWQECKVRAGVADRVAYGA